MTGLMNAGYFTGPDHATLQFTTGDVYREVLGLSNDSDAYYQMNPNVERDIFDLQPRTRVLATQAFQKEWEQSSATSGSITSLRSGRDFMGTNPDPNLYFRLDAGHDVSGPMNSVVPK